MLSTAISLSPNFVSTSCHFIAISSPFQNQFIAHIQRSTSCNVTLHGRGSQNYELRGAEKDEPLHLLITAASAAEGRQLEEARRLSESLLATVRKEYEEEKAKKG